MLEPDTVFEIVNEGSFVGIGIVLSFTVGDGSVTDENDGESLVIGFSVVNADAFVLNLFLSSLKGAISPGVDTKL